MTPSNAQKLWLKLLGGKPEHAGLGIATIAFLVALVGAAIAFLSPASPERGSIYWLGYAIVVVGVLGGWCGLIYHRILSSRLARSRRNEA
jgi:hypothetical protein